MQKFLVPLLTMVLLSCGQEMASKVEEESTDTGSKSTDLLKFLPNDGNIVFELEQLYSGSAGGNYLGQSNFEIEIWVNDRWYMWAFRERVENSTLLGTIKIENLGQETNAKTKPIVKVPVKYLRTLIKDKYADSEILSFHLEFHHKPTSIFASNEMLDESAAALADQATNIASEFPYKSQKEIEKKYRASLDDHQNLSEDGKQIGIYMPPSYFDVIDRNFQKAIISANQEKFNFFFENDEKKSFAIVNVTHQP